MNLYRVEGTSFGSEGTGGFRLIPLKLSSAASGSVSRSRRKPLRCAVLVKQLFRLLSLFQTTIPPNRRASTSFSSRPAQAGG